MRHSLIAWQMNRYFAESRIDPLSPDIVLYADNVIQGLHDALRRNTEPPFRRPAEPVDGWGLTSTPIYRQGEMFGVPVQEFLGSRAVFLSTKPSTVYRVLTTPHPRHPGKDRVVQIRNTSVPALLEEDPTLYGGLLAAAEESINYFKLDYHLPEMSISAFEDPNHAEGDSGQADDHRS